MANVAISGSYRVRRVSNHQRSAVLKKALSSGKGVRITKGQGKAIVGGSYRSAISGGYVKSSPETRQSGTTSTELS